MQILQAPTLPEKNFHSAFVALSPHLLEFFEEICCVCPCSKIVERQFFNPSIWKSSAF